MKKALIVEDDANILENLRDLLHEEGFIAIGTPNGQAGVEAALRERPDVVLCDILMPVMDGYGVLGALRANPTTSRIPFIFLTAKADRSDLRTGMNLGADDYLTKPFSNAEVLSAIRTRIARTEAISRSAAKPCVVSDQGERVVGDPAMIALYETVSLAAQGTITILLLGETGVGKEVIARAIHERSSRANRPFLALNCGALAEPLLDGELFGHERGAFTGAAQDRKGLFQVADGGTLFLDEIGDLPLAMQVKLLRVLQEREVMRVGGRSPIKVDVRIVAATHRDLEAEAARGAFRQDLYYRIGGFPLVIPPLRDRRREIVPLANAFITSACSAARREPSPTLSAEATTALEEHDWPGNIRELKNAIERALVLCPGASILREHFNLRSPLRRGSELGAPRGPVVTEPAVSTPPSEPPRSLHDEHAALDERHIREALARVGGNQTKAAELLGISRRTLVTRLGDYDLPRPRKR
jgi:DNA-binding NtrC family response regulator